jgi:hypothetical protein
MISTPRIAMISTPRILAGLAAAAVTAAVALTPTTSSDASTAGHKRPDIGARHGHPHAHRVIR